MEYKLYRKIDDNLYFKYYIYSKKEIKDIEILLDASKKKPENKNLIEIGPYESRKSSWSSNILSMFEKLSIPVIKAERTRLTLDSKFDPLTEKIYTKVPNFDYEEIFDENDIKEIPTDQIGEHFDEFETDYYIKLFKEMKRNPNNIELLDLKESNSEHSRHWFFNGKMILDGKQEKETLFKMVKSTQSFSNDNSVSAFCDNASAIKGGKEVFSTFSNSEASLNERNYNISFTAETHNFPTGVEPFSGAATGVGGRIRDTFAIGTGGFCVAGTAGYCVADLKIPRSEEILLRASDGASDYGNKFGEPIILGFCRSFSHFPSEAFGGGEEERLGWLKPIMFSGGIGLVFPSNTEKKDSRKGDLVVKVGGPAYPIGLGGGSASSKTTDMSDIEKLQLSVQRGDPEMENRLNKFIRHLSELDSVNPIIKIHDQGAGGTANVTKEIISPEGGIIHMERIIRGDVSMSLTDVWLSEFQEQATILISPKDLNLCENAAKRENVPLAVIGEITDSGKLEVLNKGKRILDLPLKETLEFVPQKQYSFEKNQSDYVKPRQLTNIDIYKVVRDIFSMVDVGSKRFLTNKVDRSVTGLISGQSCVGPYHTPVGNNGIIAASMFGNSGSVTAIGEQPLKGVYSSDMKSMVRMTFVEMLTNMMGAVISDIRNIKCSGNWMWPNEWQGSKYNLYEACKEMTDFSKKLGVAFDGGKDSLSMIHIDEEGRKTKCPETLVISGYVDMPDIECLATPYLKFMDSELLLIDLGFGFRRIGGSALLRALFNNEHPGSYPFPTLPDERIEDFINIFKQVQNLIKDGSIISLHDRSDGGLFTAVAEMSISGNIGVSLDIKSENPYNFLFNEEPGIVIEVKSGNLVEVFSRIGKWAVPIGRTTPFDSFTVVGSGREIYRNSISEMRSLWEATSMKLELKQCNFGCVKEEMEYLKSTPVELYRLDMRLEKPLDDRKYSMAVIRDEGSNGERELANAFIMAGFNVYDVTTYDLLTNKISLEEFRGIAFCGGFTYSDILGSGKAWSNVLLHSNIRGKLDSFYKRRDTFSLGICNGCQLMIRLGIFGDKVSIEENRSGRFESRFSFVRLFPNNIFFDGFRDVTMGVWVANHQGRFSFSGTDDFNVCLQYVDENNEPTERYPINPSGSRLGVAGISTTDGRHVAMMPHPERSFLRYQIPTGRENYPTRYTNWVQMFFNSYLWCS